MIRLIYQEEAFIIARDGVMFEKEIKSKYLNETLALKFYQPEELDLIYETNVCIMQDGNDYFNLGKVATISDKLHDELDITNTIFIGIHYIDRFDRRDKYHPEGEKYENYKKFLVNEVIPFVTEELPINPLGEKWTLMGDSLAGTLAFLTAIENQHLFDNIIMQSPLVNDFVIESAKQLSSNTDLEVYHTIGLKETDVGTTADGKIDFVTPNQKLHEVLDSKNLIYHYYEFPEGIHTWKYWQQDLPHALSVIFN
ncbi:MAG TPA: alpha/beta hydrolase-fold protein [Pseudogracilibacillus sp.]|nr:alpha/beta hydrolase-fold protein [Pseudogracilibacillus sp.]